MTRGRRTARLWLAGLLAVVMLAGLAPVEALAANVDVEAVGTLTVDAASNEDSWAEDLANAEITVSFYKVANIGPDGAYQPVAGMEALSELLAVRSGSEATDEYFKNLLDAVVAAVFPTMDAPEAGEEGSESEEAPAEPEEPQAAIDPAYVLTFSGETGVQEIGTGLYLMWPEDAETEQYSYTFSHALVSMPTVKRMAVEEPGEGEEAQEGELYWEYDYTVTLKPERHDRSGRLVIRKSLLRYNESLGPVMFVFKITAVLDGETVFSDVRSLAFGAPGEREIVVEGIPVGAEVTVEEIYTGQSYELVSEGVQTVTIIPQEEEEEEGPPTVEFINDYNDRLIPQVGVVNEFTQSESGAGWEWNQRADNSEQGGEEG